MTRPGIPPVKPFRGRGTWATRSKALRKRLWLSQRDLARLIGCDKSTIAKIETERMLSPPAWLQRLVLVMERVPDACRAENWTQVLDAIAGSGAASSTAALARIPAADGCPAPDQDGDEA